MRTETCRAPRDTAGLRALFVVLKPVLTSTDMLRVQKESIQSEGVCERLRRAEKSFFGSRRRALATRWLVRNRSAGMCRSFAGLGRAALAGKFCLLLPPLPAESLSVREEIGSSQYV